MEPKERQTHKRIVSYYEGSMLTYNLLLGGTKHFGFYPTKRKDISEKRAQELMQDLVAESLGLKKGQLVLDAGSGQGIPATYMAKRYGCRVVGITIVPFEVGMSNRLARRMGLSERAEFKLMDYSRTRFKANTFDAVYTMETLVHSPDAARTLREFFRILRPGGRLAMCEYTIADPKEFTPGERKMLDTVVENTGMASLMRMRNGSFSRVIESAGFKSVGDRDITEHTRPSFERLRGIFAVPYFFIKLFKVQGRFVNSTAFLELYEPAKRGLIKYNLFTAVKPMAGRRRVLS